METKFTLHFVVLVLAWVFAQNGEDDYISTNNFGQVSEDNILKTEGYYKFGGVPSSRRGMGNIIFFIPVGKKNTGFHGWLTIRRSPSHKVKKSGWTMEIIRRTVLRASGKG